MTPQEKDLITQLLGRLQQQAAQGAPHDPEAAALIRSAMTAIPDAPYYLVQTVLVQDMALNEAQHRLSDLEAQLAAAKAAPPPAAPVSFLGNRSASVPASGPWGAASPSPPPPQPTGPVWTQSGAAAQPGYATQPGYPPQPMMAPLAAPSASGGFLRQAATTAAGVAGGALLFQGIQSLFGPHYGSGFMGGMPMQPGLGETVVNNYYGSDPASSDVPAADQSFGADPGNDPGLFQADDTNFDTDGGDWGGGDDGSGNIDV